MFAKTLAVATTSALLAGGAVAYTGVAAESHSTKTTAAQRSGPPPTQGERLRQRQARLDARRRELAGRLGVSPEKLADAQGAVLKQRLDVAVANGRLTVAQRSAVLACRAAPLTCDRTDLPAVGRKARAARRARAAKNAPKRLEKRSQRLAAALGLDQQKVRDALEAQRKG